MVAKHEINIHESSINQISNNTMSVRLCTVATFVKKNSSLVARIFSIDTAQVCIYLLSVF